MDKTPCAVTDMVNAHGILLTILIGIYESE
jgi:hypothetical protein